MSVYDYTVNDAKGNAVSLKNYQGKVLLIVNTASKCGLTPQYEGLQQLYKDWNARGVEVLAFPCDQFGHQEPGTNEEIQEFCSLNYGVTFPVFGKIEVNGEGAHPLYAYLRTETGGADIGWNFAKFLIDREGNIAQRFEPNVKPEAVVPEIEKFI